MSKIPFYMSLLTERTGVRAGSLASPHELGALRLMQQLGMPPALVKFYSQLNPAGTIEIGRVQMHAVSEM
ncbi:MAG: hypothetical protein ACAI35_05090, partial [Candidatus Methylacidiphilales bacterium]|nr:hypothetical protein [Candidatus Methylacidiphilales bacterium]